MFSPSFFAKQFFDYNFYEFSSWTSENKRILEL